MTGVYRFQLAACDRAEQLPIRLRKRKRRGTTELRLLAADATQITDADGTRSIEEFDNSTDCLAFTRTRREADLVALANPGIQPPQALEDHHPWLPRHPIADDSVLGYRTLVDLHRRYGSHLIGAAAFCDLRWNTICNSIRQKNHFDGRFHSAWHVPIQDVFMLEETRPDRRVIAIDINAMYSKCMQHPMPKPSALAHSRFDRSYSPGENLPAGLYRCRLVHPKTRFIRDHNPFRAFFCGRRLPPSLNEAVEVDLNEFEVSYYSRHFEVVHLIDGVVSERQIAHPLAKEARRSFARRLAFKAQGNQVLADREKYIATLLSSCSSRPRRASRSFTQRSDAMAVLMQEYGICPAPSEPPTATDAWLGRGSGVSMNAVSGRYVTEMPDLDDGTACFLLLQRTVAMGRVLILELMEEVLLADPSVRICYVNIDSIHFSVLDEQFEAVLGKLRKRASDEMGAFKVEAVTDHGLWLEPGRYWLYSDIVEKFRNRGIGNRIDPFRDHSLHVVNREVGHLHVPIRASLRMDRSMSDSRTLVSEVEGGTTIRRQVMVQLSESTCFASVLDALERNRREANTSKLAAFNDLRHRLSPTRPAASGRVGHPA